ncbi:hypothetical protein BH11MYX1_BH11MYX1_33410 [soil metagenome]
MACCVWVGLAACGRIGFESSSVPNVIDGLPPDAPGATTCFGPPGWSVCLTALPTQPLTLPGSIDTSASASMCSSDASIVGQPSLCFVVATDLAITSNVRVTGDRALVLVATNAITVDALLDVSAHSTGTDGPGGRESSACSTFPTAPELDNSGGGGGAGGSFLTKGGKGGTGNANAAAGGTPPSGSAGPSVLRPGCAGQNGGDGIGASSHCTGGSGGGGVYLVADHAIVVGPNGTISASGAAGSCLTPGQYYGGGGGGGSGGTIVLYASMVTTMSGAVVLADGGGGAAGSSSSRLGDRGAEPSNPMVQAAGGASPGGTGGAGYAVASGASGAGPGGANAGGGGGGGGAGYVRSSAALGVANVSPPVTIIP